MNILATFFFSLSIYGPGNPLITANPSSLYKPNVLFWKTFLICSKWKFPLDDTPPIVNYLDVTFDLRKDTYLPYRRPDNPPVYIYSCSNHLPTVIKQLPKSISKRLSDLSSNKEIFEKTKPAYRDALNKSGFQEKLSYTSAQIKMIKKVINNKSLK